MKLTVTSLTVYDDAPDGTQSVGASVDLRSDIPDGQAGGNFGITFECVGAREMTFNQLEQRILERVRAELSLLASAG